MRSGRSDDNAAQICRVNFNDPHQKCLLVVTFKQKRDKRQSYLQNVVHPLNAHLKVVKCVCVCVCQVIQTKSKLKVINQCSSLAAISISFRVCQLKIRVSFGCELCFASVSVFRIKSVCMCKKKNIKNDKNKKNNKLVERRI